jgi:hypothetical protein
MSKTVYSYQEIRHLIEQGQPVQFTCALRAQVITIQQDPESEAITVTLFLSIRETYVGCVRDEYASMCDLLEAFDLEETAPIWEHGNRFHALYTGVSSRRTQGAVDHADQ